MIEVPLKAMTNTDFVNGLRKLAERQWPSAMQSYNCKRIQKILEKEAKRYYDLACDHNLTRGRKPVSEDQITDAYRANAAKLGEMIIKMPRYKIKMSELKGLHLTPAEISALEPLIEGDF